MAKFAALP